MTHLPHASWCLICVPARARDDAHRQRREIDQLGNPDVTVLHLDYSFAPDEPGEGGAKALGIVNTENGHSAATMVTQKGSQFAFGVKWVENFLSGRRLDGCASRRTPSPRSLTSRPRRPRTRRRRLPCARPRLTHTRAMDMWSGISELSMLRSGRCAWHWKRSWVW